MKITYTGTSPVDVDGHDNVQQGDTIDVPDQLAHRLLLAGSQIDDTGTVTPPATPTWTATGKKSTTVPTLSADTEKE